MNIMKINEIQPINNIYTSQLDMIININKLTYKMFINYFKFQLTNSPFVNFKDVYSWLKSVDFDGEDILKGTFLNTTENESIFFQKHNRNLFDKLTFIKDRSTYLNMLLFFSYNINDIKNIRNNIAFINVKTELISNFISKVKVIFNVDISKRCEQFVHENDYPELGKYNIFFIEKPPKKHISTNETLVNKLIELKKPFCVLLDITKNIPKISFQDILFPIWSNPQSTELYFYYKPDKALSIDNFDLTPSLFSLSFFHHYIRPFHDLENLDLNYTEFVKKYGNDYDYDYGYECYYEYSILSKIGDAKTLLDTFFPIINFSKINKRLNPDIDICFINNRSLLPILKPPINLKILDEEFKYIEKRINYNFTLDHDITDLKYLDSKLEEIYSLSNEPINTSKCILNEYFYVPPEIRLAEIIYNFGFLNKFNNLNYSSMDLYIDILNSEDFKNAITLPSQDHINNYEKLEAIGDKLFNLCVINYLMEVIKDTSLSTITAITSNIISGYFIRQNLSKYLLIDKFVSSHNNNNEKKILEDVFEAVIAAIYRILENKFDRGLAFNTVYNIIYWLLFKTTNNNFDSICTIPKTIIKEFYDKNGKNHKDFYHIERNKENYVISLKLPKELNYKNTEKDCVMNFTSMGNKKESEYAACVHFMQVLEDLGLKLENKKNTIKYNVG